MHACEDGEQERGAAMKFHLKELLLTAITTILAKFRIFSLFIRLHSSKKTLQENPTSCSALSEHAMHPFFSSLFSLKPVGEKTLLIGFSNKEL